MHRKIYLSGKHADKHVKVSPEDFGHLSQYKWCLHPRGYAHGWYPVGGGELKKVLMHRVILNILDKPELVCDHINHDPLDNRRENLRAVSQKDNQHNRSDRHKVLTYDEELNGWVANICVSGKTYSIGPYSSEDRLKTALSNLRLEKVENPAPFDKENSNPDIPIIYVSDYKREKRKEERYQKYLAEEKASTEYREKKLQEKITRQREKEEQTRREKEEKRRLEEEYRENSKLNSTGVEFRKHQRAWEAFIEKTESGKVHIGYYATREEAVEARKLVISERRAQRFKARTCQVCSLKKEKSEFTLTEHGNLSSICDDCKQRPRKPKKPTSRTCKVCKLKKSSTNYTHHREKCDRCFEEQERLKEEKRRIYESVWGHPPV